MNQNTSDKLWQGRASGDVDDIMIQMGESIHLDIVLYREDIEGSVAHAKMLQSIGVLSEEECSKIEHALQEIHQEIEDGKMEIRPELEDIHTHIENRLIEKIGDTGRKLHTARSRNDQIAVDTHLYVNKQSRLMVHLILDLMGTLLDRAREHIDTVLPGYTHLQVAQPVRLSHHLLAYFWSLSRDLRRFRAAEQSSQELPLGSGAMAGVNYKTDRFFLMNELGFSSIYPNSMDAVSSRDHILDYLYAQSVLATHASRMAEEIILWNSVEMGFVSLPDSLTTGSSIMPQKKNPDLAELIRGKAGRQISHLQSVLILLKGLPYTYNRDLQEDRFALIDSGHQSKMILQALTAMYARMTFHSKNMQHSLERGFATATDLADALVQKKQIPFREAHHIAGKMVALCDENRITLSEASKDLRQSVHESLKDDAFYYEAIDLKSSSDKKVSYGGTARFRQEEQIQIAQEFLKDALKI